MRGKLTCDFDISDNLKRKLQKFLKKDKSRVVKINKKIKEIISCDFNSINKYKNLRYDLKNFKRVHIDSSFVLIFKIEKDKIIFIDFDHHDKIY